MRTQTVYSTEPGEILSIVAEHVVRDAHTYGDRESLHSVTVPAEPVRTTDGRYVFAVLVYAEPDSDSSPEDADCYSPEDLQSYGERWSYIGLCALALVSTETVAPVLGADEFSFTAEPGASLWGIEDGLAETLAAESEYRDTISEDLVEQTLADLCGTVPS